MVKRSLSLKIKAGAFLLGILAFGSFVFPLPHWLYDGCLFYVLAGIETAVVESAFKYLFIRRGPKWTPEGWFVYVLATSIPPAAFAAFGIGLYSTVGYAVYFSIMGIIFYYGVLHEAIAGAKELAVRWKRL